MRRDVEKWQYSLLHDNSSEHSSSWNDGPASRLSTAASELFRLLLDEVPLQNSRLVVRTLQREYSCLQLWCDGYGLAAGDLDAVLANSKRLRYSTIRLLVSVCYTLADKLTAVLLPGLDVISQDRLKDKAARTKDVAEAAAFSIPSTDSDSEDSDTESVSSGVHKLHTIEDIIEDLKTDIQCLVDLGPRYKEPILDRTIKEEAAIPHQDTTWDPVESLTARIRHRYPNVDGAFARVLGQANWERAQRLFAAKEKNAEDAERSNVKDESASRAPGTLLTSEFYDSGLGTSIPKASSYTETVFSYHGTKGGSIKIPPIPAEGQDGDMSSLTSSLTASHEIECPFCQEHISGGYASHLARHLEEVSLTILPADAESDEDSDRDSDEASDEEEARRENTLTPRYGPVGDYPFDQDPFHHRNLTSENNPMPKENSDRNSDEASDKEEARKINTPTPRYGPVGAYPFDQHPFHRHNPTSENGSPVLAIMKMPKHDLPSNDIGKSAISHEELVPVDTEDEESYIIKYGEGFGQTMPNNGAAENIDAGQLDATAQKTDAITGKNPADIIKAEYWEWVEAGDVSTQAALHREVITADQTIDSEETVTTARRTLGDRLNASLRDGRGKRMF
ncbi:hypothetical protein P885DRAFT_73854 [Corynascus similis CBS 632.67]